ncbi:MAG: SdpI family protein [Lachnospiraceae bacterium]|nr:SdpI family protein [Lachnospiraceae bacterium]
MKLYRSLNMIFLIIFIIGTVLCFKYLPGEIPLFMQSPSRWVFIEICFVLLLVLAVLAFFPHKISKSNSEVRNEITLAALNLLGLGIFLFYFVTVAEYCGLQMNYMKSIVLIAGGLMVLVGNLLPQMPYRSHIGFKLPWILKDKLCWQKTHRFAGYTAIPFGIIQCLLVLFVQNNNLVFLLGIGLWIIIVCIYSLCIFCRNKKNHNGYNRSDNTDNL